MSASRLWHLTLLIVFSSIACKAVFLFWETGLVLRLFTRPLASHCLAVSHTGIRRWSRVLSGCSGIAVYSGLLVYCAYVMTHRVVSDTFTLSVVLFWHAIYSSINTDAAPDHRPTSGLSSTSCLCFCPSSTLWKRPRPLISATGAAASGQHTGKKNPTSSSS